MFFLTLPQGLDTLILNNGLFSTVEDILPSLGGSDPSWALIAALDLQDFRVQYENLWIFNLWPPGMPLYYLLLISLTNDSGVVFLNLMILTFFWSLSYSLMGKFLLHNKSYVGLVLFSIVWIFGPLPNYWMTGLGFFTSDALAMNIGALLVVLLLIKTLNDSREYIKKLYLIFIVGILMAILAHLKVIWLLTFLVVFSASIIYYFTISIRKRYNNNLKKDFTTFLLVFSFFFTLLLPWTYIVERFVHPGSYSWSTSNYQFSQRWMPSDYLLDNNASFLVSGGANWACEINISKCNEIFASEISSPAPYSGLNISYEEFRRLAFREIVSDPFLFAKFKLEKTVQTWFSKPGASVGDYSGIFLGSLTIFFLLSSIIFLISQKPYNQNTIYILIFSHFILFLGLLVNHYETRYFLPLHVFSTLLFFILLPDLITRLKKLNSL